MANLRKCDACGITTCIIGTEEEKKWTTLQITWRGGMTGASGGFDICAQCGPAEKKQGQELIVRMVKSLNPAQQAREAGP